MPRTYLSAATLLLLAPPLAFAQGSIATNSPTPLSTRVVAYNIDAKIDTGKKEVDATETLTYKNLTGQPLTTFPFHLYLNGFQPQSSFTTETHYTGGIRDNEKDNDYPPEKMGSIAIAHIDAEGYGDLTPTQRFLAPDDHNAADRTVAEFTLPHPLAPNDSITFHIAFHDKFPVSIARNGYKRDFLMGGQWFPKVGVFWHGAWNCHQYHATTEFFSDFGTFTVHLTLPRNYVLGATGVPTGEIVNQNGTKTLSFYGEDIGDFAWAASPHFQVTDGIFLSSLGPVQIHVLALAAHPEAGQRYLKIMQQSLAEFDHRYGPYPYKVLTVIDPEPDSQIGGMEYPTLFTGDTSWFDPTHVTELTAEHEFGHQYWYGMVATNEFEDAWLDEGINSYTEVKVLSAILGKNTSFLNKSWANAGDSTLQRVTYLSAPDSDPVTRHAWQFRNSGSYSGVTYGKTATLLTTLEGIVGTDVMDDAMRTYFMKYRFTHPVTEDFLRTIEQVAIAHGKAIGDAPPSPFASTVPFSTDYAAAPPVNSSLRPFLNQAVYGTQVLDYRVDSISSDPVQWWLPAPKDSKSTQYITTVSLRRKGDFILPVTVEVVFEDGTRLRDTWNGVDEWKRLTYTRNSKVVSAEIDPDHLVLLDKDPFNNSITERANSTVHLKLANLLLAAQQFAEQLITWLV
ncbi:M1 family metallopeptidase [Granulicella arctica]|uniref:M1 family metallopeptidase n=1 Tax=Granulicella arctica TaxID=940613 RepID=UPI0021E04B99|nr:M1 family metallopeptidase [Granulicella arctica]